MILFVGPNKGILFLDRPGYGLFDTGPDLWERNRRDEDDIMAFLGSVLDLI